jgi:hypothetical protein
MSNPVVAHPTALAWYRRVVAVGIGWNLGWRSRIRGTRRTTCIVLATGDVRRDLRTGMRGLAEKERAVETRARIF